MPADTYIETEMERFKASAASLEEDIAQREAAIADAAKDSIEFAGHSRRIAELKGELESLTATISFQSAAIEKMKSRAAKPTAKPEPEPA